MKIIGAGLSGLLAGALFPTATIVERSTRESYQTHDALLRFRTESVGIAVGIPFQKVRVYKALWSGMCFNSPTPMLANAYSQKVTGRILPRSVWDLAPVDRYIAPPDFQQRLLDICASRIEWGQEIEWSSSENRTGVLLSTIPLPKMLDMVGWPGGRRDQWPAFEYRGITSAQFVIPDCDAYQTIYYPDPDTSIYRASLTGNILIIEAMGEGNALPDSELDEVFVSFGIDRRTPAMISSTSRTFGKIAPIPDVLRKYLIHYLTLHHNIYSAGRYAVWKNILMDDLLEDLGVIRRLITAGEYGRSIHIARG